MALSACSSSRSAIAAPVFSLAIIARENARMTGKSIRSAKSLNTEALSPFRRSSNESLLNSLCNCPAGNARSSLEIEPSKERPALLHAAKISSALGKAVCISSSLRLFLSSNQRTPFCTPVMKKYATGIYSRIEVK